MPIPHQFADRIIREALHDPWNLGELLELLLGDLASRLDLDSVEYEDPGFLLPDMHGREADLLCRIHLCGAEERRPMGICLLVEHQSEARAGMPLRMLEYAVCWWRRLWDQSPRDQGVTLPGILPVVFFTGEGPWQQRRQLGELIGSPDLLPAEPPRWPILYLSLAEHSPEQLLRSGRGWHQALAVVRAEREQDPERFAQVLGAAAHSIDKLADIDAARHWRLLEFILRWTAARRPDEEHEALYRAAVQQVRTEHRERIRDMSSKIRMTFEEAAEQRAQERYELGKAEGEARGKAEGRAEGEAEGEARGELNACRTLLCRLLEKRFGPLSDELRSRIEAASDIERLRTCVEAVLELGSPDELAL